jgi:predicted transcriptional regulator
MTEKELPKELSLERKKLPSQSETIQVKKREIPVQDVNLDDYNEKIDLIHEQLMSELTPIEKDVLSVASNILKMKRYPAEINTERIEKMTPLVEKIYSKSVGMFLNQKGYDKESIFKAIQSLEKKNWIITGQRMTKEEILNNPIKKEILAFIEKYPAIHARDSRISEYLHITRNPFIKHMASLEAFGLIRSSKIGSTLNYFPVDLPDVFDDLAVLFQNDILVQIVNEFIKSKDITLMQLSETIGVYHRAIQYHIKKLLNHNILMKTTAEDLGIANEENTDSRRKYYKVNLDLIARYNRLFKIPPFNELIE